MSIFRKSKFQSRQLAEVAVKNQCWILKFGEGILLNSTDEIWRCGVLCDCVQVNNSPRHTLYDAELHFLNGKKKCKCHTSHPCVYRCGIFRWNGLFPDLLHMCSIFPHLKQKSYWWIPEKIVTFLIWVLFKSQHPLFNLEKLRVLFQHHHTLSCVIVFYVDFLLEFWFFHF
mgnify:CR=1 FL=1